MIKNILKKALPTGRAWSGVTVNAFLDSCANELEKSKIYLESLFDLRRSFIVNYSTWQYIFNLPDATTDEQKYLNVASRFSDRGGQSVNYVEDELRKLGFDVSITPNVNPVQDLRAYLRGITGITLGNDKAYLNSQDAFLGEGLREELIVNYVDYLQDLKYFNPLYFTNLSVRWSFAFFIHAKNSPINTPAEIDGTRREEFRRKVLELKNFGTWAFALIKYK